jgi:hypothetical protein
MFSPGVVVATTLKFTVTLAALGEELGVLVAVALLELVPVIPVWIAIAFRPPTVAVNVPLLETV